MRTLVLHHSRTGTTERVATAVALRLGADSGRIVCDAYRGGLGGFRMAWDILTRRTPSIRLTTEPAGYDRVVVGGPVWANRPATPLRSFLTAYGKLPALDGVFLVHGTADAGAAEAEALGLVDRPVAFADFREDAVKAGDHLGAIEAFVERMGGADIAAPQGANLAGSNA